MRYLLAMSFGPVQEFIAAARRTADLQAGSELLVTVVAAAARVVRAVAEDQGGRLIFPAAPDAGGANKLLAELATGDPAEVAGRAQHAAHAAVLDCWRKACGQAPQVGLLLDEELAGRQLEGLLEIYAAWTPCTGDYPADRRRVEGLLAARKALRDFAPSPAVPGRPKSPLDPARDCVLRCGPGGRVPDAAGQGPLWLKPRETLDAVSLLKRLAGGATPSTSEMVVRGLLPSMRAGDAEAMRELERIAGRLRGRGDLGDLFFPERWEELDLGDDRECVPALRAACLRAVGLREAPAYYAILLADGDRMGALLDRQTTPEQHQEVSQALTRFTEEVTRVVRGWNGHLVYAGGDDVLALLPVNGALGAARGLAGAFAAQLQAFGGDPAPTLSVGVAVVHHMEPLDLALEHARAAERHAKQVRNAVSLSYHTRGSEAVTFRTSWATDAGAPRWEDWETWIRAFREGLSRGVPYELREMAQDWPEGGPAGKRLRDEVTRVLKRKQEGEAPVRSLPCWLQSRDDLANFARLLVLARLLATYPEVSNA